MHVAEKVNCCVDPLNILVYGSLAISLGCHIPGRPRNLRVWRSVRLEIRAAGRQIAAIARRLLLKCRGVDENGPEIRWCDEMESK